MSSVRRTKTNQTLLGKSKSKMSAKSKSKSLVWSRPTALQENSKEYYKESYNKYKNFFLICVREIEELQLNAFACIQISRFFTSGVLPQYCHIPDPLTPKQRQRVEQLLLD